MLRYLQQMLQLVLSPSRGWEDVASHPVSGREAMNRGLLPLAVAAGLSVICRAFYEVRPEFSHLIPAALVVFIQYMLTYYLALAVLSSVLPRMIEPGAEVNEQRLSLFVCYPLGMMCVIGMLENLLPGTLTLIQFLPLYVAVVMFLGRDYLGVRRDVVGGFIGVTILSVIVPVFLIGWLLAKFI